MNESAPDAELVAYAREGDREAWEVLARRHAPRLAAYLGARLRRPDVVEKLVSEAIYAGWRKIPKIEDDEAFAPWFRRLGANLALRWHSKHKQEKLIGDFPAERCGDDSALAAQMQRVEVELAALDEADRMALEQRFRGGLHGEELAEALHKDCEQASAAVEDALDRLLTRLAQSGDGTA